MYIVKGYNIINKETNESVADIVFSGFSNLIFNFKKEIEGYRQALIEKNKKDFNFSITIVFIIYELSGASNEAKVIKKHLIGESEEEIANSLSLDIEKVNSVIENYIHSFKLAK